MKNKQKTIYFTILLCLFVFPISLVRAQSSNPFSPFFRLSTCDGPRMTPEVAAKVIPRDPQLFMQQYGHAAPYVPCDFGGLLKQINFLLTAMISLGVVAAIVSFTYAGYLYIRATNRTVEQAKGIFRKTGIGFLIMLTSWFVVYQLLIWLAANPAVKTLLGNP